MSLLFIDIETTGLDPQNDHILEVSAIKANNSFHILDKLNLIIKFNGDIRQFHEVVQEMHTKNNLWKDCASNIAVSKEDLGDHLYEFMNIGKPEKGWIIAGSSAHFDREFLKAHFSWFGLTCHYRLFDVRSLLQCCDLKIVPPYEDNHRAEPDNLNSIYTARCYQKALKEWKAQ